MELLGLPVAWDRAGKLPAELSYDIGVGVVLDRIDIGFEGDVFTEFFAFVIIHQEAARQLDIGRCGYVADGRIDGKEVSSRSHAVEDLGEEPRAGGVQRVHAGHPEGYRQVALDLRQEINAAIEGGFSPGEVISVQQGAGVIDRVGLQAESLRQPGLQVGLRWRDGVGHDADGGAPIDLLQSIEDRPQEVLVVSDIPHVIDGEDHGEFNAVFADPLGRCQPGEIEGDVVGVALIQVGKPISICRKAMEAQAGDPEGCCGFVHELGGLSIGDLTQAGDSWFLRRPSQARGREPRGRRFLLFRRPRSGVRAELRRRNQYPRQLPLRRAWRQDAFR